MTAPVVFVTRYLNENKHKQEKISEVRAALISKLDTYGVESVTVNIPSSKKIPLNSIGNHIIINKEQLSVNPKYSFVISLGGDGTYIAATDIADKLDIPILGINLGTVGFLTQCNPEHAETVLEEIFSKKRYFIEFRTRLEARYNFNTTNRASNEITFKQSSLKPKLSTFFVHTKFRQSLVYKCDGLIISTPNGSTGYNLSANGPVVSPELKLIIITPICPYRGIKNPIILHSTEILQIEIDPEERIYLGFDCNKTHLLMDTKVEIYTSPNKTLRLQFEKNFHDEKLNWLERTLENHS